MRRIPIHIKLAAALIVPLLALVGVVVLELMQSTREADEVRSQVSLVKAATGPSGLFNAIQDERNRASINLIGQNNLLELPCPDNESCRTETDQSLEQFRAQIENQGDEAQTAWAPAFEQLDGLADVRTDVDAQQPPYSIDRYQDFAVETFNRFSTIIDTMLEANAQVAVQIDDPELRRGADLAYFASREVDLIARMVTTLLDISVSPADPSGAQINDPQEWVAVGGQWHIVDVDHLEIIAMATGDYREIGEKLEVESDATGLRFEVMPEILRTGHVDLPALLESVSIDRDESYYGFRDDVREIVEAKADTVQADAERRVQVFSVLAGVTLLIAIVAMLMVSLSITRPLRLLTRQATDMANQKLPDAVLDILDTPLGDDVTIPHVDPVAVHTRDEVADVADALNTVQDSALDLAVEQAVLRRNIADSFVNLGRRNQNLLGRQLDFITELEHNETDPDTLANLFRLDHLATRMRRNAESLLVLAGIDPPRKWAAPVRITDAIRAALGEVEDYQRVTVRAVEPTTIMGSAAADLAHLLAELIENALIFSPPDQTVEIRGRTHASPGSPASGYTLAIIDSGLGMPPEELARANRRLAGAESFTIAPSKYLGHYVAGNLAARHNINVQLHNSPGHGITATINIPPTLLTAEQQGQFDTAPGAPELRSSFAPAAPQAERELDGGAIEPSFAGAAPGGGPQFPSATAPGGGHTASGLAKRQRRTDGPDNGRPNTTPPVLPDNDLLETLAQYTDQLHSQPTEAPTTGPLGPPPNRRVPSTPPTRGTPLSPATGTPALSHLPPFPVTPPGGTAWAAPRGRPGGAPPPPRQQPATGRRDPLPPRPSQPGQPPKPASPPKQTQSGLARRVRGAQLPNTQPIGLRRGGSGGGQSGQEPRRRLPPVPNPFEAGFGGGPPASPPSGRPSDATPPGAAPPDGAAAQSPSEPPTPSRRAQPEPPEGRGGAAKDVYGFLSDFTAGVQRGLDESSGPSRHPDDPSGDDDAPAR